MDQNADELEVAWQISIAEEVDFEMEEILIGRFHDE